VIEVSVESWMLYLILVLAACASPGPAVLFAISNSTLYGWKKALYAASGNITGLLLLGIVAVMGLGTLLNTSLAVFNAVKYAGAAYLFYIGLKLIFQKSSGLPGIGEGSASSTVSSKKVFFQAIGVAISNPKAIVFLTALFPQFINTDQALIPQFILLIGTLMFFSFLFLMAYAVLALRAKGWLNQSARMTNFNRATGSVFIGFGLLLAASSNK